MVSSMWPENGVGWDTNAMRPEDYRVTDPA
jgi:hypothetical protein